MANEQSNKKPRRAAMDINTIAEEGMRLTKEGRFSEALKLFDQDLSFTHNPAAMSFYALCLAEVEGNYERAISLCLMAAEKEFYNPEIYLNLGRIFLMNGQKNVAVKSFKKGLRFDTTHAGLIGEIRKLGLRRKPVFGFLQRTNALNRLFGRLSYKIV